MSGPTDDLSLGSALRSAREAAGRTVEQVSADTRIRATLIRHLEADSFESSGASVYARGHIKSIASALHVDAAPLLQLFDRAQGPQVDGVITVPAQPTEGPSFGGSVPFGGSAFASAAAALTPERRGPRWGIALSGAAVALAGITSVGYFQQHGTVPSTNSSLNQLPATSSPQPAPRSTGVPTQPDLSASKPPVSGAQLRLRLIGGASWVSVSNGSATLFEGILKDGEFRDFHDPTRLKVVVGNRPAVSLNCGGRDSGPVASNNRRVGHYTCTAAGLVAT